MTLPWFRWWKPWTQCRAVKDPYDVWEHEGDHLGDSRPDRSSFWGRCELERGHRGDHALERGFDIPRWSTKWTG